MRIDRVGPTQMDALWELQKSYKAAVGEPEPDESARARLAQAVEEGRILFFAAWDGELAVGCCSVTPGFSTFDYAPSGVFEDFYIRPAYRHRGLARELLRFAYRDSGVSTLTVGCADCDLPLYRALGFTLRLGTMLALE